jgi:hypothetical protein
MAGTLGKLECLVLQSVANDYENFEMILSEIAKWTSMDATALNVDQIKDSLMKAIERENIKAYEYSEESRQFIAADADRKAIHSLWFYITEQGKKQMQKLEQEG